MQCCAQKGCAVIGSAAAKSSRDAGRRTPNEAAHHRNFPFLEQGLHDVARRFGDRLGLWLRAHEISVSDEHVTCVDVLGVDAAQLEERRHQVRGELFPERGNGIEAARCRMTKDRKSFRQTCQFVERSAHLGSNVGCFVGCAEELFALLKMAVAECLHSAQGADQMSSGRLLANC